MAYSPSKSQFAIILDLAPRRRRPTLPPVAFNFSITIRAPKWIAACKALDPAPETAAYTAPFLLPVGHA